MIYTRRRRPCVSLPIYFCIFRVAPRYAREMQNLAETREPRSVAWISNREIDLAEGWVFFSESEFFFGVNRDRHARSEFRAAIFIGTASENQLNGNNESPMHVERSAYVLQSCNAIVCPRRSGTYFQICIYTRNWWVSRANFYRWYWNRIISNNSTKSVNKLCRYRARVISMKSHKYRERDWKENDTSFEEIRICPERENRYRIPTIWSRNNKLTFYQSQYTFWICCWLKYNLNAFFKQAFF